MPRLPAHILIETGCRGTSVAAITSSKGAFGIDTPLLPADTESWKKKVREKAAPFAFVVQMDSSPDRAFAAAHLSSVFDGFPPTLLAHQQTADSIKGMQDSFKNNPLTGTLEASNFGLDPLSLRWPRPAMVFNPAMTVYWDPVLILLRHAPSVTPGACWVHLPKEEILFVGDAVSVSLPPLLHEARFETWLETLAELRRAPYKTCRIFCSHGGWIDGEAVSRFVSFLRSAQRRAASIRERNDPHKEAAQAASALLEYFTFPAERKDFLHRRLQVGLTALWEREHTPAADKASA